MPKDDKFLFSALVAAQQGCGHTRPNPPVGAVLVHKGEIVGEGYHHRAGCDHAEVEAIKDAQNLHPEVFKSRSPLTLYVTLEPCSKPGRVGACTDAIIAAGIRKVVWACRDPNPKNRGRAARVLEKAGIATECWECSKDEDRRFTAKFIADWILRPFEKHVKTGRPYVTVKLAISLDGKICDDFGSARWISSEDSRRETGELRETVDVVMVGAETVRKDNPSLLCHTKRNDDLYRAIVSKSGKLPRKAQVFTDAAKDRTLVYRDVVEAIDDLGKRGFLHVLCEGGLELARSLAAAGLVDEWITVVAPIVIGHNPLSKAVRLDGEDAFVAFSRSARALTSTSKR